ncbi:MAG: sulfatase-like hydrolase/transferase [Pirellulaceae bacterium]|nr:sulfatase-like hydrolase/transferase [Pirellulaceae bacterium]
MRLARNVALGFAVLLAVQFEVLSSEITGERPNVLLIITDSMTNRVMAPETQCMTPHLDKLATEGVRLHRYYTTNPACSPARASIMTGTYPSKHHINGFVHAPMVLWRTPPLNSELVFWSQRLSEAGYTTTYFGKWHVEKTKNPKAYGFQEYQEEDRRRPKARIPGSEVTLNKPGYPPRVLAGVEEEQGEPPTHPTFDNTIEFIRSRAQKDQPFCYVCTFAEPHLPAIPPKRFHDMYDVNQVPLSPTLHSRLEGKSDYTRRLHSVFEFLSEDDWRQITTCYNAMVTFLDGEIGRVIAALKEHGIYDNTIIIVTSDHGTMHGGHGLIGHLGATPYEEAYNVPFIARGPGIKKRGEDHTSVASHVDLGATLVDLCGAKGLPDTQGRSMRPILEGRTKTEDWQDAYAEHDSVVYLYTQRILWHGPWKYIYAPGGIDELYNIEADAHEERNLAVDPEYRSMLEDMTRRMWKKMFAIDDKIMLLRGNELLQLMPVGPRPIEKE